MALDSKLLALLVCPLCKGELNYDHVANELIVSLINSPILFEMIYPSCCQRRRGHCRSKWKSFQATSN